MRAPSLAADSRAVVTDLFAGVASRRGTSFRHLPHTVKERVDGFELDVRQTCLDEDGMSVVFGRDFRAATAFDVSTTSLMEAPGAHPEVSLAGGGRRVESETCRGRRKDSRPSLSLASTLRKNSCYASLGRRSYESQWLFAFFRTVVRNELFVTGFDRRRACPSVPGRPRQGGSRGVCPGGHRLLRADKSCTLWLRELSMSTGGRIRPRMIGSAAACVPEKRNRGADGLDTWLLPWFVHFTGNASALRLRAHNGVVP